jgi:calpain-7
MGGYDFPGSNSGVDMHTLTGWIPERMPTEGAKDSDWMRMMKSLQSGNLLITVATGPISKADEERTGLADCHAYVEF